MPVSTTGRHWRVTSRTARASFSGTLIPVLPDEIILPNMETKTLESDITTRLRRVTWLLRARDVEIKLKTLAEAVAKANFNPNEPRVPAGNPDGGQWTTGGGSRTGTSPVLTDVNPDPIIPGARYAQTQINVHTSALTGIESIDTTTTKLAYTLAGILDGIEILPDATPQKYGMIVHELFANAVRFGDFEGIGFDDVETTFSLEPDARYGAKGSIRTDVVLRNTVGDIIAIYDVKTGKDPLGPKRVREIREKTGAGPNVPVFEVHILRGVTRKHLKVRPRLVWIVIIRKWHALLPELQDNS
jgi:hypothetical protein